MKVAVYAIAKNEEQFATRWADSAKDADLRFVLDTGSTDNTCGLLRSRSVHVLRGAHISPFRFDVARNISLAMLPPDIDWCICLDLDEVLEGGWRDALDDLGTRKNVLYHWSPEFTFYDDRRIHRRLGYAWRYPCHEELYAYGNAEDELVDSPIEITHLPDPSKSRAGYLDLLAPAARVEYPGNPRMAFYYARELCFRGLYNEAVDYFRMCALTQMSGLLQPSIDQFSQFMREAPPMALGLTREAVEA